jgi:Spy/CpxP family protein refolding chaperone
MSLKQKFLSAITLAFALLTLTVFASAQDKSTTAPADSATTREKIERRGPGGEGRGPGMRGMDHDGPRGPGMMLRALHQVGLTDAQKEQIHTILESKKAGFEQTHQQLRELGRAKHEGTITAEQQAKFDELRAQIKQNAEATHEQILGILTAEQRTRLEQMKQEMDKRREEHRGRGPRPGRGEGPPAGEKPADKPVDN